MSDLSPNIWSGLDGDEHSGTLSTVMAGARRQPRSPRSCSRVAGHVHRHVHVHDARDVRDHGGHLPLWLSPRQAIVATITDDADNYAREVVGAAKGLDLRVEPDLRNEKINYKVREHSLAKVPVLLVVGRKEAADRTVSIRRLGQEKQVVIPLEQALAALADEAVPPDLRRNG